MYGGISDWCLGFMRSFFAWIFALLCLLSCAQSKHRRMGKADFHEYWINLLVTASLLTAGFMESKTLDSSFFLMVFVFSHEEFSFPHRRELSKQNQALWIWFQNRSFQGKSKKPKGKNIQ